MNLIFRDIQRSISYGSQLTHFITPPINGEKKNLFKNLNLEREREATERERERGEKLKLAFRVCVLLIYKSHPQLIFLERERERR